MLFEKCVGSMCRRCACRVCRVKTALHAAKRPSLYLQLLFGGHDERGAHERQQLGGEHWQGQTWIGWCAHTAGASGCGSCTQADGVARMDSALEGLRLASMDHAHKRLGLAGTDGAIRRQERLRACLQQQREVREPLIADCPLGGGRDGWRGVGHTLEESTHRGFLSCAPHWSMSRCMHTCCGHAQAGPHAPHTCCSHMLIRL